MSIYNEELIYDTDKDIKIASKRDFYWGILDRDEMKSFVDLASREGYNNAIKNTNFTNKKFTGYTEEYYRADFHFFLPVNRNSIILDLGSGYGNITIPLAHHYEKIVAADASLELLQYIKYRAESVNVHNIDYVKIDPLEYLNLPFKSKSFDVIIISGLLEWVGVARLDKKPQVLQQEFLLYLSKLLKDDGIIYLAIENRLFPGWLGRDPHSKLKLTSILPRQFANIYAKYKGKNDGYRTYIYSKFGYKKMLAKAGLLSNIFYYPFTSYRAPELIYPSNSQINNFLFKNSYAKNFLTKKWFFFLKFIRLFKFETLFLSSFMIIASKKKNISKKTPILIKELSEKYKDIDLSDTMMKVDDKDKEYANFLLFHTNSKNKKPYAKVKTRRNSRSDYIQIDFIESH